MKEINQASHFIDFLLKHKALQFGQFKLKSGRISPYFFNVSLFSSGLSLGRLGEFYAAKLLASGLSYDLLYGPAYKGISLVTATAIALANRYGITMPYCFNRKEAKDHGEGGFLLGAPLKGRVIMIDDVITAGTTVKQTLKQLKTFDAHLAGIVIALDRQERNCQSITQKTEKSNSVPVYSIITLTDILFYLHKENDLKKWIKPLEAYQAQCGR